MIRDIVTANENIKPNSKEIQALKEHFPACFDKDGNFDLDRFKEYLSDKLTVKNEGYELRFLGKNYSRLLASLDTETVIEPDAEHNAKAENANSQNIYISGDNLDGLKQLLKSYSGSVKCIYIDPPYNTGSDGFVYNDKFNFTAEQISERLSVSDEQAAKILDLARRGSASHSAWLMFMYPRLQLARDLLSDDGVIFISIDDNEVCNLKLICDDIFGEQNFAGQMTIQSNPRGSQNTTGLSYVHEYVLMYSKNETLVNIGGITKNGSIISEYSNKDEKGNYRLLGLRKRGGAWRKEDRPNMYYPIYVNPNTGNCSLDKSDEFSIEVIPQRPEGDLSRWTWSKEKFIRESCQLVGKRINRHGAVDAWDIFRKDYLLDDKGNEKTARLKTIWTEKETNYQNAKNEIKELFGNSEIFDFPKPTYLIQRLCEIITTDEDVVLDFFSGSGTTAHAVMLSSLKTLINKNFIMVQIQEKTRQGSEAEKAGYKTIDEIGIERIKRAAKKILEEYPNTTADLGFKHYTLREVPQDTLDKMEEFTPDSANIFSKNDLIETFGEQTVLATYLVRDGYGFNADYETLDLASYKAYYIKNHLYLLGGNFTDEALEELAKRFDTDPSFNPQNVVLFAYSFDWRSLDLLKVNLKRLKDTEKNLRLNFDMRY